ncbi:MAG TPA: hypothetical protein VG269_19735 [Tepidisphaeraceae bacterium]|nr:hypothetical protein [Tepidisphaeraceae bacterium]
MLIVRLKQCECAIAAGRLDEAFELVRPAGLRADRRGQELVGHLAQAFAERGEHHASAGRAAEALADCEKAAALSGNTPEVARLRSAVAALHAAGAEAAAQRQNGRRQLGRAVAAAARYRDAGQLTVGEAMLAGMEGDERVEEIKQDLSARRASLASAMAKATASFDAGDWESAVAQLAVVRGGGSDSQFRNLSARISSHVTLLVNKAIDSGRVDQAAMLLTRLDRLGHPSTACEEARTTLAQCRSALEFVQRAQPHQAVEVLRRLAAMWPKAAWLAKTAEQLREMDTLSQEILAGPLGLVGLANVPPELNETLPPPAEARRPITQPPAAQAKSNIGKGAFLLHVDGVGSYHVASGPAVSAGPANGPVAPDVALLTDARTPRVTFLRSDDDYFLQSVETVLVNGKPTTGTLLNHGDKIALAPRCRLTFRRPNAASSTAILDLVGTRLPRSDVGQIVLLDRELLIGPGMGSHVRCDDLAAPAVLQQAGDGGLLLRSAEAVQVDGRPAGRPAKFSPGQHVRVGPVSFVITRD